MPSRRLPFCRHPGHSPMTDILNPALVGGGLDQGTSQATTLPMNQAEDVLAVPVGIVRADDDERAVVIGNFIDGLHVGLGFAVKKFCDDAYETIMEGAQTYLKDNAQFNIGSQIDCLRSEVARLNVQLNELGTAADQLVNGAFTTYRAGNGKQVSIEADDGEACYIVHSDLVGELRAAISAASF